MFGEGEIKFQSDIQLDDYWKPRKSIVSLASPGIESGTSI